MYQGELVVHIVYITPIDMSVDYQASLRSTSDLLSELAHVLKLS